MPLATKDQVFAELWNHGFFAGFDVIVRKYNPDNAESGKFKSYLYSLILKEVLEAKNEAARLQGALQRMEGRCRQGMAVPGNPRIGMDANSSALQADIHAVDGWIVSLFESDVTLIHYMMNIETAGNRSAKIHDAIRTVMDKRRTERKLFESDTGAFALKLM